jgi:hypothetical protein
MCGRWKCLMRATRDDNAFAQNDIAEKGHFAGRHNGMRCPDAGIEVCTVKRMCAAARIMCLIGLIHGDMDLANLGRIIVQRCPAHRVIHVFIQWHNHQDCREHCKDTMPICPHQSAGMFLCWIVAIHQCDFIAMAHGPQREQQVRAEYRWHTKQHHSSFVMTTKPAGRAPLFMGTSLQKSGSLLPHATRPLIVGSRRIRRTGLRSKNRTVNNKSL